MAVLIAATEKDKDVIRLPGFPPLVDLGKLIEAHLTAQNNIMAAVLRSPAAKRIEREGR